jgi:hypothetical protein
MSNAEELQAAYDHFAANVHYPVFFGRLKQAGLVPNSEEEAQRYLYLGGRLYAEHQAKQAGEAEKRGSLLDMAIARLDGPSDAGSHAFDRSVKQAADNVVADRAILAAGALLTELY